MYIYTVLQALSGSMMTDASTQTEHIQLQDAEIQKSWEKAFAKQHGKKRSKCAYCSWHGMAWRRVADTGEEAPMAAATAVSGRYQRECDPISTDTAASGGDGNSIAYSRYEREWETMEADTAAFRRAQRSEDTVPTDSAASGRCEREWVPMAEHTAASGRDARREQVRLTFELSMLATKEIRLEQQIRHLRNERDMWMRRVLVQTTCTERERGKWKERKRECD